MKRKLLPLLLMLCMLLAACGQKPSGDPVQTDGQSQPGQNQQAQDQTPPDDGFSTSVGGRVEDPGGW